MGGKSVECYCDNAAVVAVVNSGRSRDNTMMHLLRCLFFMAARFHVRVKAVHIPGALNTAADALSRNNLSHFLQVVPESAGHPTPIPPKLVDLLVRVQPDWTSLRWEKLFSDCCKEDWLPQRSERMHQANASTYPSVGSQQPLQFQQQRRD